MATRHRAARKDTAACVSLSQSQLVKEQRHSNAKGTHTERQDPPEHKARRLRPAEDPVEAAPQRRPVDEPYLDNPDSNVNSH